MKRNCFDRKDALLFIEFTAVFVFLLLPPLFSTAPFILPPKPAGWYARCIFCCCTLCAAAYEETLYRLYTPNRLHRIYSDYIKPRLPGNFAASENNSEVPVCLLRSALSHKQSRYKKAVVSKAAEPFEFFLTEFPALLLFTLAHRYLGSASMLFAAIAGFVFRIAYLKLKRALHPAASIALVAAVHGLWNIGVYYYLWGHSILTAAVNGCGLSVVNAAVQRIVGK